MDTRTEGDVVVSEASLREFFSACALIGILVRGNRDARSATRQAVECADKLIEALNTPAPHR